MKSKTDELETPLTEEFLRNAGFKWHQLERQPEKHWLLWLGDAVREDGLSFTSFEDIGLVVAEHTPADGNWFCWLRSDLGGRYSRFIHIRYLQTQEELIQLCEALTGQTWDPENNLYGSMRKPAVATRIRKDDERFDRKIMKGNKWSETEKDDSMGRALPEHLEAHEKAKRTEKDDAKTSQKP